MKQTIIKQMCYHCSQEVNVDLKVKFFPTNLNNIRLPKYNFQIQAYCPLCEKWIKHLPQDDLTIGYISEYFNK